MAYRTRKALGQDFDELIGPEREDEVHDDSWWQDLARSLIEERLEDALADADIEARWAGLPRGTSEVSVMDVGEVHDLELSDAEIFEDQAWFSWEAVVDLSLDVLTDAESAEEFGLHVRQEAEPRMIRLTIDKPLRARGTVLVADDGDGTVDVDGLVALAGDRGLWFWG